MMTAKKRNKLVEGATPYLFLLPWMLGFAVLTAGPLVFSLVMSFFDWSITGTPKFIALQNFVTLFKGDPQFYKSLVITFRFAAIFVPLNLIIALFLAMLITQPVGGVKIFRIIFYLPSVVSSVAIAIIWGWILNGQYGILNYLLSLFGIKGPLWLLDQTWAFVAVIIASAWGVGTMMLIFYTDIKTIPADLYEAAALDGITPLGQFIRITIPIITPSILFNLITSIITALQQLSLVLLLTGGGPLRSTYFYGMFVYNNAFRHHKLGYAAASSWFMFIIILILTMLVFRSSSAWVYYESEVQAAKPKMAKRGKKQ
jgi:multiple sugar transport system permease protein